jgi:hypothetical protein
LSIFVSLNYGASVPEGTATRWPGANVHGRTHVRLFDLSLAARLNERPSRFHGRDAGAGTIKARLCCRQIDHLGVHVFACVGEHRFEARNLSVAPLNLTPKFKLNAGQVRPRDLFGCGVAVNSSRIVQLKHDCHPLKIRFRVSSIRNPLPTVSATALRTRVRTGWYLCVRSFKAETLNPPV